MALKGILRCVAVLLLPVALALSQTGSTEITGLVTDPTGAAVPGAKIRITRVTTGESRSAVTDSAGEYIFTLIEIGEYTVKCERQGFKTRTVTSLHLHTGQKLRVDLNLEVAVLVPGVSTDCAPALPTARAAFPFPARECR